MLALLLPMFVRAGSPITDTTQPASARASAAYATLPPADTATATPAPTPAPTAQAQSAPVVIEEIFFSDATPLPTGDTLPTAGLTPAPTMAPTLEPAPEPTPMPTDPPGVWTYDNGSIAVRIEKKQQGDFVYFAADIRLTKAEQLWFAFSNEQYGARTEALSDIAARHNPLIAINGDYYGFHNNGIIIRGGELYRKNKSSRALLVVEADGTLVPVMDREEKQGVMAARLMDEGVLHTFEFGPVLVQDEQPVELHSAIVRVGEGYLEPRTAIGQYGPLHYLVLVVDGRSEGYSAGCDLPTLQQLFVDHGVTTAFNLDGGGSTTLWFDGEVINHPSSGDERKVSDIVMFMRE